MDKPVFVLNGSNLNLLGIREPHIYGHTTLTDIEKNCEAAGKRLGIKVDFRQSNHEGTLIDWIHEGIDGAAGIIINPAGYTFYSMSIMDALKVFRWPIIELHISNIHRREEIYHHSLISRAATAVIAGCGAHGYVLALEAIGQMLKDGEPNKPV